MLPWAQRDFIHAARQPGHHGPDFPLKKGTNHRTGREQQDDDDVYATHRSTAAQRLHSISTSGWPDKVLLEEKEVSLRFIGLGARSRCQAKHAWPCHRLVQAKRRMQTRSRQRCRVTLLRFSASRLSAPKNGSRAGIKRFLSCLHQSLLINPNMLEKAALASLEEKGQLCFLFSLSQAGFEMNPLKESMG
ncbi:unnamed protein product [Leuciscus chuanchicus]